ncbi:Transketolase, N-terminal section [Candidatus Methanomethylophilus alvi Mx1201]|uniref:Transketolase, N-terminal section n=2 Tax=Methanomethylophilus alvi TaxID=1291540 RepID=M9S9B2_METAX|nr:transketolase [Methanomethylophilus alvi]AGI84936.1 Transketolase, N-terminal section [Candidatus Methanomethylophilus alvi Mx1201]AYQ54375.1 transketolase [Methanomethylophilus alvi]MCI5974073.1 transketolase [Methanomethylophilus alvi]
MSDISVGEIQNIANRLRLDVVEMTTAAGSGHPGGSLSSADLLATLYFRIMNIDPADPYMEDRDRFVLSKGHAAPILYATLAERGYFPTDELKTLRQLGSRLQGHPAYREVPGVEVTTGSLGQGLSMACGMALAGKMDSKDYRVYCLMGDGELQEGQNWEAAMFAHRYGLNNLIGFVDRNRLQICGNTEEVMSLDPLPEKFRAFGWNVIIIDGHNIRQIIDACDKAARSKKNPTVIIMNTIKGKGVSFMENNVDFHGRSCKPDEYAKAVEELKAVIQ